MKKIYGKGVRVTAVLLQQMFAVIAVVCAGILILGTSIHVKTLNTDSYYYRVNPFSKSASFEDSEMFRSMLYDNLKDIIRYGVICDQLETDGHFDEEKEIDIEQYARHFEEVPVEETSVAYRLGDLLQWGQYGLSTTEYSRAEVEAMMEEARRNAESMLLEKADDEVNTSVNMLEEMERVYVPAEEEVAEATAHIYMPEEYSQEDTDTMMANASEQAYTYEEAEAYEYVQVPVERYLPADGVSLLAHVDSVEELMEMTDYLMKTVPMLADNLDEYKEYQSHFDSQELNFRYCIRMEKDGELKWFSNVNTEGAAGDTEALTAYFGSFGRYLYFAPVDFFFESNTGIVENEVRSMWNSYRYAYPDNCRIWMGLDTSYPWQDYFSQARDDYNRMVVPGSFCLGLLVISSVFALGLLGLLTVLAGRRCDGNGEKSLKLLRFDRLNIEMSLLAAAVVGTGVTLLAGGGIAAYYYTYSVEGNRMTELLALLGAGALLVNSAFLFFYLSLVRRLKAGLFWKNFLVYRFARRLKALLLMAYDDSRNVAWIWLPYGCFVFINAFLFMADAGVLAVLMDIFAGAFLYRESRMRGKIVEGIRVIQEGDLNYQIPMQGMHGSNKKLAEAVNNIGNGIKKAVETSMKDERLKADLITNVSHDIKTPLTSIINYVDLIKREPIENEKIKSYVQVLDNKSQRLKTLTEDLVEASKISSGNITLQMDKINVVELLNQTLGEFEERFAANHLMPIVQIPKEPVLIEADSRRIWRVMENLCNNICKYAMENTRVYVDMKIMEYPEGRRVRISLKNISAQPLNVDTQDLTERFIRGDVSRTTEGSGLGLSIAKNLTELQKGSFEILSDGDLFKVNVIFSVID